MSELLKQLQDAHSFLQDPWLAKAIDEIAIQQVRIDALLDVIDMQQDRIGDLRAYLIEIEDLSPSYLDEAPGMASAGLKNDAKHAADTLSARRDAGLKG
jgi:hypothetical protein